MSDNYDRTLCATELKIRDNILKEIKSGRVPCNAFEVPMGGVGKDEEGKENRPGRKVGGRNPLRYEAGGGYFDIRRIEGFKSRFGVFVR